MTRVIESVPYIESNSQDIKHTLDFYIPETIMNDKILIFLHGGSVYPDFYQVSFYILLKQGAWRTGDKSEFKFLGNKFASMGLVTAIPNYRLSLQTKPLIHPEHVKDCAKAVSWIYNNSNKYIQKDQCSIYLAGHSAGAQLATLLVFNPEFINNQDVFKSIKGCIGIEGIYDIPKLIETFPTYIDFISMAFGLNKDVWALASPRHSNINSSIETKFLIVHSNQDELVDTEQSIDFVKHIRSSLGFTSVELYLGDLGLHDPMLKIDLLYQKINSFILN